VWLIGTYRISYNFTVEDGHTCVRAAQAPRWFKCIRPEHPAHGGVTQSTVQCRPASACARKSPPGGCTLKKPCYKTRQVVEDGQYMCQSRTMPRDGSSA